MFNINNYQQWLKSNFNYNYFKNPNCKYKENDFLNALCQFEVSSSKLLGGRCTEKFKSLMSKLVIEKPNSVSHNNWFLYLFGYKYCVRCKNILNLDKFSSNISLWDKKSYICKICDNIRGKIYKDLHKEQARKSYDLWYKNNKYSRVAASAKRRALRKQATSKWITIQQKQEILNLYKKAKDLTKQNNIKYHIDHIIPLSGINVIGLHVPWNLQILTAKENQIKQNKLCDSTGCEI